MAEQQKSSGASEVINKGANAAHAIRGAVKTGKAIAGAAKGAAVGGPYGAIAAGLWQNRKTVMKIILAAAFVTVKEVSELIHTNQTYVYSLIKAGLLPALKLGAYKIRKEALLTFLETYEGQNLTSPGKIVKIDVDKDIKSEV